MKLKKLLVLMLAGALSFATLTGCSDDEAADTDQEIEEDVEEEDAEEEDIEEEDADVEEEDADAEEEETDDTEAPEVLEVPVVVANATSADFTEIYLSVSGSDEWGDNLLDADTYLPSGHMLPLTMQIASAEGISWDLKIVDPNGDYLEWYDLDISEMPTDGFAIELMWDGETGTANLAATPDDLQGEYATEESSNEDAQAQTLEVPVVVANATSADFTEIYLSVSGSDEWGNNLLDADTYLPSGHMLPLTMQIASAEGISWDLKIVDPNGDYLEWYDINISEMPTDGFAIELMWDGETGTAKLAATPDDLEGEYVTE